MREKVSEGEKICYLLKDLKKLNCLSDTLKSFRLYQKLAFGPGYSPKYKVTFSYKNTNV